MSIADGLDGLGFAQHATPFEEEAIDLDTLAELDDGDVISQAASRSPKANVTRNRVRGGRLPGTRERLFKTVAAGQIFA